MEKELKRVGVTKHLLWQEYRAQHPRGYMFSQFCYYYRQWKQQSEVILSLEHKARDKLLVDFSGKKLQLHDPTTGEVQ